MRFDDVVRAIKLIYMYYKSNYKMDIDLLNVSWSKETMSNETFLELFGLEPVKKTHTEFLYDQCPELRKIMENFEEIDTILRKSIDASSAHAPSNGGNVGKDKGSGHASRVAWIDSLKKKYTVIKGHVQSGKTNFMICASALFVSMGYNVVHLLRDRTSDREQIYERLLHFQEDHNKAFGQTMRVIKTAGAGKSTFPQIYLALSNKPSVSKVMSIIKSEIPYILFIDEVDFVDSGDSTKKYESIQEMKKGAYCVFGISATIMDPIGKENITSKNIILLGTASKHGVYKGVDKIQLLEIDEKCKYTGSVDSDLFKEDVGLSDFCQEFVSQKPFIYMSNKYPNICLVNICRTKEPCFKTQLVLGKKYPNLATIVYNGDGISFRQGKTAYQEKITISKCLQRLKDNGGVTKYPHIIIFAGDLAGRCISFVSEDYKWHLTDQRLLISSSCDEPELIQKIRLCGVYNDEIPLKLHATKKTIDELRQAYLRQEEILCALKKSDSEEYVQKTIEMMEMNAAKFGRRSMVKDEKAELKLKKVNADVGWDISTYKLINKDGLCVPKKLPPTEYFEAYGQQVPSDEEYEEYEEKHENECDSKIFAKIEGIVNGKKTNQSMFFSAMSNAGINKSFKYDEIIRMLSDVGYKMPKSILPSFCGKSGFGFNNNIFDISGFGKDAIYTICTELRMAF